MGWREKAKEALEAEHNRHNRHNRSEKGANVPNVPNVPASPARALRLWHERLSALDTGKGPAEIDAKAWAQLCLDSWWLYEAHAAYAVRNGWTAQSLFGVSASDPYAGGLAQVLRSCRSVAFDGQRAFVRSYGVTIKRNAAGGAGLPLIWELAQ